MLCTVTLAVPLVSLRSTQSSAPPVTVRAGSYDDELAQRLDGERANRSASRLQRLIESEEAQVSSTTTAAPTTTTPTTVKVVVKAAPKPTTTTTRPRVTTTTAAPAPAPAPSGNTQEGKASWYEEAPAGTCAHRTLPKGTIVTVTNVSNGKRVQCRVADRGPYIDGWIIDLSKDTFSELAPLSAGVISVRIQW